MPRVYDAYIYNHFVTRQIDRRIMYTRYIVYTGREGCMTLIHCDIVCVCAVYPLFVLTWLGCVKCAWELRLRWGGIYARQTASL